MGRETSAPVPLPGCVERGQARVPRQGFPGWSVAGSGSNARAALSCKSVAIDEAWQVVGVLC